MLCRRWMEMNWNTTVESRIDSPFIIDSGALGYGARSLHYYIPLSAHAQVDSLT